MKLGWNGYEVPALNDSEWPQDTWAPTKSKTAGQTVEDWLPEEGKRPVCAVPGCNTLGKFWRRTGRPMLEGQWACGRACLAKLVEAVVWQEMGDGATFEAGHRHRVPLGLVMLAQGTITQKQLQSALSMQRTEGTGRIGDWLVKACDVPEEKVTRALSVQWNCPIVSMKGFEPRMMSLVMPRKLREYLGVLPVRLVAGKKLYLGAEQKIDASASLVLERMTGLTVEAGVIGHREMAEGSERLNECETIECLETHVKSSSALIETVTSALMQAQPIASRIVRLHEFFWVRMWLERGAFGRIGMLPATGEDVVDLLYRIGTVQTN